jgi:PKD repeat protein
MDCSSFILSIRGRDLALAMCALAVSCGIAIATSADSHAADLLPSVKADFKWTPGFPASSQTVNFESTSQVTGIGNAIAKYQWDLDGDTGNGFEKDTGTTPTVSTTYPLPGQVAVRLRVTDTLGNRNTLKKTLTVVGQAPVASFTFAPAGPLANQPVTFSSTSVDPDGTIADLTWDLDGNSVYDNGAGPTALRTFPAAGAYVVGLRATDNEGAVAFYSQTVIVGAASVPPPIVSPVGALRLLSPFPIVRIAGRTTRRGVHLKLLTVDAPQGSSVLVRCRGRGCPFKAKTRTASFLRLHRLERPLRAGVMVRIYVTSRSAIGKYTLFKILKNAAPVRVDGCLMPGSLKPVVCPSG